MNMGLRTAGQSWLNVSRETCILLFNDRLLCYQDLNATHAVSKIIFAQELNIQMKCL